MSDNQYKKLSNERKKLQAQGLVPEWMNSAAWQIFKKSYAYKGEKGVRGRHETIAKTLAGHMPFHMRAEWEQKFFDILWKGWLSPASPVLSNTGTTRGMPVSCSGGVIGDTVDSFYTSLHEQAILSKNGFGCSGTFSDIRPRGSEVSTGGTASGAAPVIEDFATMASKINQGMRRGATASYLHIDHDDFDEVIDFIEKHPDGYNIGWIITDAFTERLRSDDEEAQRRYQRVLYCKMVTGKGYLFFIDKVNRARPQMYKDFGLTVKGSNLCVSGETKILTIEGHVEIASVIGVPVKVWNGKQFSEVIPQKTGTNQSLMEIKFSNGQTIKCTEYHKFYVQESYSSKPIEVRAKDLLAGNKMIKLETPVIDGILVLDNAYAQGFYSGDGCNVGGNARIYLYGEKRSLISEFEDKMNYVVQDNFDREYFYYRLNVDKSFVPSAEYNINSRLKWFAGLADSDGTVSRNGDCESLQISSVNKQFLQDVQLMLQTLGVQSKVTQMLYAGYRKLPLNDGSGDLGDFYCQDAYRLIVGAAALQELVSIGFETKRLKIDVRDVQRNAEQFVKVTEVAFNVSVEDTYCFNEPIEHKGVFNGILTGQCNEIRLYADDGIQGEFDNPEGGHTFTCVLSSMNVAKYDEWKDTDAIFVATVFLDCVVSEFLERCHGINGMQKAYRFTKKSRPIGLGQLGIGTYFQMKGIPYESLEADYIDYDVQKQIFEDSLKASKWLAELLGEPEWCKGYGVRNSHRCANAPNKTSSQLMGGISESFSPDPAMAWVQSTTAGDVNRITPVFLDFLKSKNLYNDEIIDSIVQHVGSCQHLEQLTDEEKLRFKTGFEMDQSILIRRASRRQKHIDQGQSLNIYVSADGDEDRINDFHCMMIDDEGIHGAYYVYSQSGVVISNACVACEG